MQTEDRSARIISMLIIAGIAITMWYMMDIVLVVFILCFIFYHLVRVIKRRMDSVCPFSVPENLILVICYLLFIGLLVILFSELLPAIAGWGAQLGSLFINTDLSVVYEELDPRIKLILDYVDVNSMVRSAGLRISGAVATYSTQMVAAIGYLLISLLLAFIILLEKNKIAKFGKNLEQSRFSDVYKYLMKFGTNFCATFGKVMTVQITIAAFNAAISMLCLAIMGFPAIPALGLMIFVLGLIPVAGVIISLIPLCIIGLSIGGLVKVAEVVVMICVIHAIEAYILNPQLMSSKTRLPVCFVFIILLVGEHYMGMWGLLIGVPVFIFIMNMLEVDYQVEEEKENKKRRKKEE